MLADFKQRLLRFKDRIIISSVNKLLNIILQHSDSTGLTHRLKGIQLIEMLGHISCEDQANESFSKCLDLVSILVFKQTVVLLEHQGNRLCSMVVLLYSFIMVSNGTISHCVDVVDIGEAVVIIVMACGCKQC